MPVRERPLTSVLTQVVSDVAYLLQTEIRLVRTEMSEKLSRAANSGAFIGAGAILLLAGLFMLLLAAVHWLAIAGLPEEWGTLLVAVVAAGIGGALVMSGVNSLKGDALVPRRSIDQLRADVSVVKEQVK